jgi:hypothetical protein
MKLRTTMTRVSIGLFFFGGMLMLGFACSGDDTTGPLIIPLKDASVDQGSGAGGSEPDSSMGSGGSAETGGGPAEGGSAESGPDATGGPTETDAADAADAEPAPTPTWDPLNATADPRVPGCDTFNTQLPNPLPPLP